MGGSKKWSEEDKSRESFKDHFAQAYRRYQIRKKATAAAHGYRASENHTQEEKYFKGKRQAYLNYANLTLVVLIQHLYADHGTISPMNTEESE